MAQISAASSRSRTTPVFASVLATGRAEPARPVEAEKVLGARFDPDPWEAGKS